MQNLLYLLPLLACPLSMVLIGGAIWVMARANKGRPGDSMQGPMTGQPIAPLHPDDRLAHLHAQLDDVHVQMQRLAAEPPPYPVAADAAVSPSQNAPMAR